MPFKSRIAFMPPKITAWRQDFHRLPELLLRSTAPQPMSLTFVDK